MTSGTDMTTATAIGAILALLALPLAAQRGDDEVTAGDLGVDRQIEAQASEDRRGGGTARWRRVMKPAATGSPTRNSPPS